MYPQPVLSANIYCAKRLDAVIGRALVPFWRQVSGDPSTYLWLIRHSRGGEHLKVRLHGPPDLDRRARLLLEDQVAACFVGLPPSEAAANGSAQDALPVIDLEDAVDAAYPDRTLLWTAYRPSPVTFGAPILAEDPSFQSLFTRVLGAGCGIALDLFAAHAAADGEVPVTRRQSLVFKLCVLTLQTVPFDAATRSSYLAYHRDWLVRWMLANSDPQVTTRESVLELFGRKLEGLQPTLEVMASLLGRRAEEADADEADGPQAAYRRAVREYFAYIERFRGDHAYALDPYTDDQTFLPLFKVLHNLANCAGLGIRNEAFAYHLLTAAAGREPS